MMDTVTLKVLRGGEMPVIGAPMMLESSLSNRKYIFTPKRVKSVRWHPDGSVIIDVDGTKRIDGTVSEKEVTTTTE